MAIAFYLNVVGYKDAKRDIVIEWRGEFYLNVVGYKATGWKEKDRLRSAFYLNVVGYKGLFTCRDRLPARRFI